MSEAEAEFVYEGKKIIIQCNPDNKMIDIIKSFELKEGFKKEEFYYMYGGGMVNENLTFNTQANKIDGERKKISILVNKRINEDSNDGKKSLKKSKYIICPKCKEKARILVNNYQIGIYDCKNGHKINNILINDFEETQNIDEAKIKCQNCNKKNKSYSYNNIFFICLDCKKNLCQICRQIHDKAHNIINYEDKFFTCELHYESNISYCTDCKRDMCMICERKHNGHKIIYYGSIMPEIEILKEDTSNFLTKKEALKNNIKDIIHKLNYLIHTIS